MEATTTNGRSAGRAAPPLEHTFKDSGITVRFRRIAPMTQQALRGAVLREMPRPEPPVVTTELGDEPNDADPDYAARLAAWDEAVKLAFNARLFKLACLNCEVEIDAALLEETRHNLAAIGVAWETDAALTDDENDRVCYIEHVACATPEDMQEFYQSIIRRSVPTEAAIQEHTDSFRG